MDAKDFREWRHRLRITQAEAANLLALTDRAVQHYEGGTRGISPRIERLCFAVERRFWRGKHKSKGTHDFYDPRDIVATPQKFFKKLDREFKFDLDVCALPSNAKCRRFFTPEMNGLAQEWSGTIWMNPPYFQGRVGVWLKKAWHEVQKNKATVVALIHVRTSPAWWHDYALRATEIRFVRGRLGQFRHSAVLVFRPRRSSSPKVSTIMV